VQIEDGVLHVLHLLSLCLDDLVQAVLIHLTMSVPGRGIGVALVDHLVVLVELQHLPFRHEDDGAVGEQLIDEERIVIPRGHDDAPASTFQFALGKFQPALDRLRHGLLEDALLDFR
jgi:hypothetical protein